MDIDQERFLSIARNDAELQHKLRSLDALIRINVPGDTINVVVTDGEVALSASNDVPAEITISAPDEFWELALVRHPKPGYESLSVGQMHGALIEGDVERHIAPYLGAIQRLFLILRTAVAGESPRRKEDPEPYWKTDCAVGRYVFADKGGVKARVYYEEAGTGSVPLVLQHTAGADGRQYRHMLANPELQERYRMIAWDLPSHGKSLPPVGERWWERNYQPTKQDYLEWTVAITRALGLDKPIYLGCSLGGHLALDLAAHHAEHYRAFISVNGWYELRSRGHYDNDIHRNPKISTDFFASRILAATAPGAPESSAQEVYWVYRSNFPGVYPGDNDYFMNYHDLREDGHLIDTAKTPVIVVNGEYDPSELYPQHGGTAIAKNIAGVEHIVLPELGHFAPCDDPVRFCDAIIEILDRIERQ